ncbi:GNAT family N-acetyltransferase [Ruminococcaceae bacterium OttesenSCG-928-L11]|nr:GNAT family N-acetyltransferase [Ruminococcaceae bacterium OttesenSCG-928-L11]
MIIPVDTQNKAEWARLCNALWPHNSPADMLEEWEAGKLPHEFLYYREGQAVAFVSLSLRRDYVEGTESSPVGYIEGIYVEPALRQAGIARELIAFAGDWSRQRGCTEMASDCEVENTLSRRFHAGVGFEEAGVNVHFTMKL